MVIWPQENIDLVKADRDNAWKEYTEMFEAAVKDAALRGEQTPGPVYSHNLHQAHNAWWQATQEYQQRLDDNEQATA